METGRYYYYRILTAILAKVLPNTGRPLAGHKVKIQFLQHK